MYTERGTCTLGREHRGECSADLAMKRNAKDEQGTEEAALGGRAALQGIEGALVSRQRATHEDAKEGRKRTEGPECLWNSEWQMSLFRKLGRIGTGEQIGGSLGMKSSDGDGYVEVNSAFKER